MIEERLVPLPHPEQLSPTSCECEIGTFLLMPENVELAACYRGEVREEADNDSLGVV